MNIQRIIYTIGVIGMVVMAWLGLFHNEQAFPIALAFSFAVVVVSDPPSRYDYRRDER